MGLEQVQQSAPHSLETFPMLQYISPDKFPRIEELFRWKCFPGDINMSSNGKTILQEHTQYMIVVRFEKGTTEQELISKL